MTGAAPQPGQAGRLAALHAAAFSGPGETAWTEAAFADLLDQPGVFAVECADGFGLLRVVVDEAEILTLAVRPEGRRRGQGRALVEAGVSAAAGRGAARVFLEVAEDNAPALALYARTGFVEAGRRAGYFAGRDGSRRDALLLVLNLPARLP